MANIEDKECVLLCCCSKLQKDVFLPYIAWPKPLWWTVSVFHSIQHICLPLWGLFTSSSHFKIISITQKRECTKMCFENNIWGPWSPPPHHQTCASRALGISVWSSGFFQSNYHFLTQGELQGLPCGTSPTSQDVSLTQKREHRVHNSWVSNRGHWGSLLATGTVTWQLGLSYNCKCVHK